MNVDTWHEVKRALAGLDDGLMRLPGEDAGSSMTRGELRTLFAASNHMMKAALQLARLVEREPVEDAESTPVS